jgi:hypothetical protein
MNLTDTRSCEWYTVEGYKVIGPLFHPGMFEALVAFASLACSVRCPVRGGKCCRHQEWNVGVWRRGLESYGLEQRERMKDECAPGMLINCPSFRAAPRIWESLDTRRVMFASVIMTDCIVSASDVVERRKISEAAS